MIYRWNVVPYHFRHAFKCGGVTSFHENGSGTVVRETAGRISVNIPVFGRIIEREIVKHLYQNQDVEARFLRERLAAALAKETGE